MADKADVSNIPTWRVELDRGHLTRINGDGRNFHYKLPSTLVEGPNMTRRPNGYLLKAIAIGNEKLPGLSDDIRLGVNPRINYQGIVDANGQPITTVDGNKEGSKQYNLRIGNNQYTVSTRTMTHLFLAWQSQHVINTIENNREILGVRNATDDFSNIPLHTHYSLFAHNDQLYEAQIIERLPGSNLDGAVRDTSSLLPLEEVANAGVQIGKSIDKLGEYGAIHGDVKPANILRFKGEYFLVDFDLSTAVGMNPLTE
ncbi:MAG: hypothetical protein ABIH82_03715, partial [Candidatus Woesearchaeota archaeon]